MFFLKLTTKIARMTLKDSLFLKYTIAKLNKSKNTDEENNYLLEKLAINQKKLDVNSLTISYYLNLQLKKHQVSATVAILNCENILLNELIVYSILREKDTLYKILNQLKNKEYLYNFISTAGNNISDYEIEKILDNDFILNEINKNDNKITSNKIIRLAKIKILKGKLSSFFLTKQSLV
jgi:hypothetical protein